MVDICKAGCMHASMHFMMRAYSCQDMKIDVLCILCLFALIYETQRNWVAQKVYGSGFGIEKHFYQEQCSVLRQASLGMVIGRC